MAVLNIITRLQNQASTEAKQLKKDIQGIDEQSTQATKSTKSLTESWGKFALGATAVLAVGKQVLDFQQENIRLAGIQEDAERQLAQTVESTGGAAGYTATELKRMASGFQEVTRFGDEATIQGQSLLLTFTNIGRDVFPQATETMLDMSQALGQDMKSSAIQLGKALNDPITGVTALQRVGVSFTESQKEQIKTLVENGRTMEAQKLILAELSREFGGSAQAAAETYTGQVEQLTNSWGDLREQMGYALRITEDQINGTKGLVETTTAYLSATNRLKAEVREGTITQEEYWRIQNQLIFTNKEATEVLEEYAKADIEAEQAALELNTRIHDTNKRFKDQAVLAAAARDEIIDWHQEAAEAAGVNQVLADKLAHVNNKLSDEETALIVAQDRVNALSEAAGNGAAQNAGYAQSLGVVAGDATTAGERVQSLSSRLAGLPSEINTRFDFQAFGIDTMEKAERLIKSIQGFQSGPGGSDPYGGQVPGESGGGSGGGDPYATPQGYGDSGGIPLPSSTGPGSGNQGIPTYQVGTNGWQTVPGPVGAPRPVILHGGERFNVQSLADSLSGQEAAPRITLINPQFYGIQNTDDFLAQMQDLAG